MANSAVEIQERKMLAPIHDTGVACVPIIGEQYVEVDKKSLLDTTPDEFLDLMSQVLEVADAYGIRAAYVCSQVHWTLKTAVATLCNRPVNMVAVGIAKACVFADDDPMKKLGFKVKLS